MVIVFIAKNSVRYSVVSAPLLLHNKRKSLNQVSLLFCNFCRSAFCRCFTEAARVATSTLINHSRVSAWVIKIFFHYSFSRCTFIWSHDCNGLETLAFSSVSAFLNFRPSLDTNHLWKRYHFSHVDCSKVLRLCCNAVLIKSTVASTSGHKLAWILAYDS